MALVTDDIRIFKSDQMNDTDSGGGDSTSVVVANGESNSVFDDVAQLDRVYGNISLRKLFSQVFTQNTDKYFGAHTIISKLPKDEQIGVNLFSTGDWHDRRAAAADRITAYRSVGSELSGRLLGTQFTGSKVITFFQSDAVSIPDINSVLYINQYDQTETQYVKILELESTIQQFTLDGSTFEKRVVKATISEALKFDFYGIAVTNEDDTIPTARLFSTITSSSGKYYSARKLDAPITTGETELYVDDIFSQLIPSSLQEEAITNQSAYEIPTGTLPASDELTVTTMNLSVAPNASVYLGQSFMAGTLNLDGITDQSGILISGGIDVGIVNPDTGGLFFNDSAPVRNGNLPVQYMPSVITSGVPDSYSVAVTDGTRGLIYTKTLETSPAAGSFVLIYRSFGSTYKLSDDGNGTVSGDDPTIGTGTIDYQTNQVNITLGALPDVGSEIIGQWSSISETIASEKITLEFSATDIELPLDTGGSTQGIDIGSCVFTWGANTATADSSGVITGDATGRINSDGALVFKPVELTSINTVITLSYNDGVAITATAPAQTPDASGVATFNLGVTNIVARTLRLDVVLDFVNSIPVDQQDYIKGTNVAISIYDDGIGGLEYENPVTGDRLTIAGSSVNYTNGDVSFGGYTTKVARYGSYGSFKYGVHYVVDSIPITSTDTIGIEYMTNAANNATSFDFNIEGYEAYTSNDSALNAVSNSLSFKIGTKHYYEADGIIYSNVVRSNGSRSIVGSFDLSKNKIVLTESIEASQGELHSLALTTENPWRADFVTIVPLAPVRAASFTLTATAADGTSLTASADANGTISGSEVLGEINIVTGTTSVRFGQYVTAAGNESEWWYDAGNVEGTDIWKPTLVDTNSVTYSAIGQTFLPLSSDILGLDPVRLPEDGRVVVFEEGDIVVIHNTQTVTGTYSSSTDTTLPRTLLSSVEVRDSSDVLIDGALYDVNLSTGVVSWGNLTGLAQPLSINHTIEDLSLLTDVQIHGKLTLNQPLAHDYPVTDTLVSSALIHGDMFASVSEPFDQKVFTNEWSDALIGESTSSEMNTSVYPIAVTNASTIQERWIVEFVTSTSVNIIGETVGQVATAVSITADVSVLNPITSEPYFTIDRRSFGSGWDSGNVIRFNTYAASAPIWVTQSVGQGTATNTDDDALLFCISVRGGRSSS